MARPQEVSTINGKVYKYPSKVESYPYFMSFHFTRYVRPTASSDSRWDPSDSVYMPLPDKLAEEFAFEYGQKELGIFRSGGWEDLLTTGGSMLSEFKRLGHIDGWGASEGKRDGLNQIRRFITGDIGKYIVAMTPTFLQDNALLNDAASSALAIVRNPHMTMVFDGVELRKHSFSWTFSPRNAEESMALEEAINVFRFRSHPTFSPGTGRFALDFPHQVFCNFIGSDFLYPVKRAVVTSINVDNSGGGTPSFFANDSGHSGAPTVIKLTVNLCETEILTSADFDEHSYDGMKFTKTGSYASPSVAPPLDSKHGGA